MADGGQGCGVEETRPDGEGGADPSRGACCHDFGRGHTRGVCARARLLNIAHAQPHTLACVRSGAQVVPQVYDWQMGEHSDQRHPWKMCAHLPEW
jgi:hypothetical protein